MRVIWTLFKRQTTPLHIFNFCTHYKRHAFFFSQFKTITRRLTNVSFDMLLSKYAHFCRTIHTQYCRANLLSSFSYYKDGCCHDYKYHNDYSSNSIKLTHTQDARQPANSTLSFADNHITHQAKLCLLKPYTLKSHKYSSKT